MEWISTKDKLPEEGKYVLARHNRGTWSDSTDQENVNCVIVKLKKGISKKERELMRVHKLKSPPVKIVNLNELSSDYSSQNIERCNVIRPEDEDGNNLVPYNWTSFGPDSFFGQTIEFWTPINKVNN